MTAKPRVGGLDVGPQAFELKAAWERCAFSGLAKEDERGHTHLDLVRAGVAWFDPLQVVPR